MIKLQLKWIMTQALLNIRSLSFYILAILLGLGFVLTDSVIHEYNEDTRVLLMSDESAVGDYCIEYLSNHMPEGFDIAYTSDLSEIKRQVAIGDVACGVVISGDASDYTRFNNQVEIYQTAGAIEGYVFKEILYPIIYRATASDRFMRYLEDMSWDDGKKGQIEYISDTYTKYLDNIDINIYDLTMLEDASDASLGRDQGRGTRLFIYVSLIVLVTLICTYDVIGSDVGFYKAFTKGYGALLRVEKVLVTVVMAACIALILWMIV